MKEVIEIGLILKGILKSMGIIVPRGALNALVYAIGLFYGRKLTTHRAVVDFVKELASEYKDDEMGEWIYDAETIHANFFHDFMDESKFEYYRPKTEKLLKRLVDILNYEIYTQFQGR